MGKFAQFTSCLVGNDAFRVKIRYCSLTDSICTNKSVLNIRKDSPAKQEILDEVISWIKPAEVSHLLRERGQFDERLL
jgi:hypothetical protein